MSRAEREWWGLVDLEVWDDEREVRALGSSSVECLVARDDGGRRISVTLRWPARDLHDALGRIHELVGLDPTAFKSGYPLPL
jgi:hypothetical protein